MVSRVNDAGSPTLKPLKVTRGRGQIDTLAACSETGMPSAAEACEAIVERTRSGSISMRTVTANPTSTIRMTASPMSRNFFQCFSPIDAHSTLRARSDVSCSLMRSILATPIVIAAVTVAGQVLPRPPAPDLILINGRVITVDRNFTVAEGVAVVGDRILTTGNEDQLRAMSGPATRIVDLKGHTVIPGLMDNHLHGAGGGPGVDLSRARSLDDVYAAIAVRVKQSTPADIVLSNSDWHEAQLKEQRLPLRDDLDKVAPRNPVVLVRGGHEYILNSAALARWNITSAIPQPTGGRITRYADGRLNGELVDTAKALVRLPPAAPRTPEQQLADRVADYKKLNEAGLTSIRHPGISIADYRMLQEMRKREQLTIRINALLRPAPGPGSARRSRAAASGPAEGDAWLRIGGVKLAVDGGFEGGLMREPYEKPWDENGTFRGLQTLETERFFGLVRDLNRLDWRVATHAVGDAAIDLVLNAYEKANAERSIVLRRWSIEHAFIGQPDHLPRMKALGVAISAQNHLYLAGPSLVQVLGKNSSRNHDAGKDVSRCGTASLLRHRCAGRSISAAVDDLSLRDARHDHRRCAGSRSARDTAAGTADGDHQQRVAQHGRADQGID